MGRNEPVASVGVHAETCPSSDIRIELRRGYSGRRIPAELLARLRAAAHGLTSELTTAAMAEVVLAVKWTT